MVSFLLSWVRQLQNIKLKNAGVSVTPWSVSPVFVLYLLRRAVKKKPYLRLANKKKRTQPLDRGTLPRRPASRSCVFTVDVETGVLWVLFNAAASWGLVRCLFLKLDTYVLVLLLSCAPGPPTPFSILVRGSLHCSVNGVVHSVVWDLQFLGIFSHGVAFISQNKNRLTSFRRNCFVCGHFEALIEPTNADAPDTQLV